MSGSRRFPANPILGVGALIFNGGRVLLVERGKEPLSGYWSLPGGVVETGERLEHALIREVFEETGLHVSPGTIATVFERIMYGNHNGSSGAPVPCEYHYVLIDFYCTIDGGDLRPGDDSSDVRWFEIDSLSGVRMTEGTREVIEACCTQKVTHPYVTRP